MKKLLLLLFVLMIVGEGISEAKEDNALSKKQQKEQAKCEKNIIKADKKIEKDPKNAEYYLERALIKQQCWDFEGAIKDYNETISLNPNKAEAYYYRGNLQWSEEDCDKAMQLNPKYDKPYLAKGQFKLNKHDKSGALASFDKAIKINSKNATAYCFRGTLTRDERALADFNKAIQLDPREVFFYLRGTIEEKLRDYKGCVKDMRKSIKKNPNRVNAYWHLFKCQYYTGDYKGVIKTIDNFEKKDIDIDHADYEEKCGDTIDAVYPEVIFIDEPRFESEREYFRERAEIKLGKKPANSEFYFTRGNEKHELGDHKGAIADYSKAIELDPKDAGTYNNRGCEKEEFEDYDCAIADYSKAIELDPKYTDAYCNRGGAKNKLGDYKGAIVDFSKVIELDPKDTDAYYNRGYAKNKLGDYKGALADCEKSIELDSNNSLAYYYKGEIEVNLKKYKEALKDFNRAIELDPENASYYLQRATVKEELGDKKGAQEDRQKAEELENQNSK